MLTAPSKIQLIDLKPTLSDFRSDVVQGLSQNPKKLYPKYFYDETGSALFNQICDLKEYYPTRTEIGLLKINSPEMAQIIGPQCLLFELGCGSVRKVHYLLEHLKDLKGYVPIDISKEHLVQFSEQVSQEFPNLDIYPVCADYTQPELLQQDWEIQARKRVVFFPGSTVGNLVPQNAVSLMKKIQQLVGFQGGLLIGVDLKKNRQILEQAYNDRKGITEQFNFNLLTRINQELKGNFDLNQFEHKAFFNETESRIEMHLKSRIFQKVVLGDQEFSFKQGETIHTENSYKYTVSEFEHLASQAGFHLKKTWIDEQSYFSIHYLEVE